MKPFFIHFDARAMGQLFNNSLYRNGFTAYIQPAENPREVKFSVVFCSKKDQFVKKTGRSQVQEIIPDIINKREIPRLLAAARAQCFKKHLEKSDILDYSYFYVYRYVL